MKMMRKLWTAIAGSFVMLLVMMPSLALAAKKAAANVVIVADIGYKTPRRLWCSLISDARVRVSMDMKHSGLLLCNPKLNKQNYYI